MPMRLKYRAVDTTHNTLFQYTFPFLPDNNIAEAISTRIDSHCINNEKVSQDIFGILVNK